MCYLSKTIKASSIVPQTPICMKVFLIAINCLIEISTFYLTLHQLIQIQILKWLYQFYSKLNTFLCYQALKKSIKMIELYNITVVINNLTFEKGQTAKIIFHYDDLNRSVQNQPTQKQNSDIINLTFSANNIAQSNKRIKLQFRQNSILRFSIQRTKHIQQAVNTQQKDTLILCHGCMKFEQGQKQNYSSWELQSKENSKVGYLTGNFDIFQKNGKRTNQKITSSDLLIFSIKMNLIPINDKKRFFIVMRIGTNEQRMVIKGIEKGWIVYHEVLNFQAQSIRQQAPIDVQVYSFDSKCNSKELEATSKTSILTNFNKQTEIKYEQLELLNPNNIKVGKIQFKYCLNNKNNKKTISIINSRKYIENSISPSKLMVSMSPMPESLTNQLSTSMTSVKSINQFLIPHHKNKSSNTHLSRRKNYSALASNNGISIGLKDRFQSPKVLTNSYCYYGHKTLDARQLPTRQIYKFASFGFSSKPCLKNSNQRKKNGPGPGGYRLPSIFDRYG